jgi:hypothetical protein
LVLDEAIATPRSGHFIKNASKLYHFYCLVATAPDNHIENSAASLWFVAYSSQSPDTIVALLLLDEAITTPKRGRFIQNSSK